MHHGDIQLTSSSTMGAGEYHHNQHSGSSMLTHSSHGTKLTVMGGKQESSLINGLPRMPPPLVHCPTAQTPTPSSLFELAFVAGNIEDVVKSIPNPQFLQWTSVYGTKNGSSSLIHVAISRTALVMCIIIATSRVFDLAVLSLSLLSWKYLLQLQCNCCQCTQYLIKQMPGRFTES